jgi:hypothetical protein
MNDLRENSGVLFKNKRKNQPNHPDYTGKRGNDGPFIVNVTGHYYAVSHGEICDTLGLDDLDCVA